MDGFKKFELAAPINTAQNKEEGKLFTTMRSKRKLRISKKIWIPLVVVFCLLATLAVATIIPAYNSYVAGMETYRQAKLFSQALKQQDIALASTELEKTKKELAETREQFKWLSFYRFIPIANWYYNDADHALKAGTYGLDTAAIVIDSVKPYADILGLKGQGSFSGGSAEERIQTAVMTMGKITPRIDEIADSLVKVREEMDGIDAGHYPEFIFGTKIKRQLSDIQKLTDDGVVFVDEARPLIKVLSSLLGEKEEKKYLILFQNDKELRPTGGFITAYSIFNINKGVLKVERSDDIYPLDDSVAGKPQAPAELQKYLKVARLNLRDTNISPDFVESMKTFNSLYEKASAGVDVDGIIAIDTHVLVSTIKILDDQVNAGGMTFTTKNDDRCDCPQVIYDLENTISRPVNYVKTDRKGLIGDLMYEIMNKALSSSPKQYWGPLFQSMLSQINQKHILFYLYDKDAQHGLEALNAAGRIKEFEGDYLHINDTNLGGAKSNIFIKQTVENSYEIKKDGSVIKTVTIDYKNPFKQSDCNLERGNLCLNASNRDWFRIYVPKGSKLIESKGSQVKIETYEDLGKTVFDGFIDVRPEGSGKLVFTYQLPFKLAKGSPFPVLIQKQPGTEGAMYTIRKNGKKIEEFQLLTDKTLELDF